MKKKIKPSKERIRNRTTRTGGRHLKSAEVSKALIDSHGIVAAAARCLGCSRNTIHEHIKKHPQIAAAVTEARETIIDVAESKLFQAISAGERWAILEVLHGPGRDRGYGEPERNSKNDNLEATIIRQVFLAVRTAEARGIIPPDTNSPTLESPRETEYQ